MSNGDLLKRWKKLAGRLGYEEALALLVGTKKISASTAERLSANQYKPRRPSKRTRDALLEVLGRKAS